MNLASKFSLTIAVLLFLLLSGNTPAPITVNACVEPITYRIGKIDARFDISEEELKTALEEAAEAWAEVVEKPVALYSPKGEIVVNLVYDERQQLVSEELSLRKKLSSKEQQIRNYESVYRGLVENFKRRYDVYQQQEKRFATLLNNFNKWVEDKNKSGGLREEDIPEYKQKKAKVDYLKEQINKEQEELNKMDAELQRRVNKINATIDEKNTLVDNYNKRFSGKRSFIQGIYAVRGNEKKIEVYQFLNLPELRLVLAHEIGHALGIKHVSDSRAVMFDHTQNQSKTVLELTEADKNAIKNICSPYSKRN